ncbi:cell surface protein SprA [Cytophagales bacterium WSM2-2]|nr:cell surface protein SprA [Cytophagales bacterium WSM2-2]
MFLPVDIVFAQDSLKTKKSDTTKYRVLNPYLPNFRLRDRHGDPFSNYISSSPFFLKDPKNLNTQISLDTGMHYNISEKVGKLNFRPNSSMSFQDFSGQQDRSFRKNYYQGKSLALDGESAVSSRNLLPKLYLSPLFDRLFGGSYVELNPKGTVTLDLGGSFQKIQNPAIPIRQQRNGGLDFGQQIQLSMSGKIGEKVKITSNFDTNNSFDFQNSMKVEYTGLKEDLLKKLEIGNVSLPLNNSLIKGSQNLFGVKAQLQFGKLMATVIASTQRGKQSTIHVSGSGNGISQGRPFEIVASNYDDNRHFFLAQFFRDNFEKWLGAIPGQVTSGINITRIEVYSINRQNDTQTLRDVVAFMDMAESDKIYRKDVFRDLNSFPSKPALNGANDLFARLKKLPSIATGDIEGYLKGPDFGVLAPGTDYEKVNSARKLASTEYTLNAQLGYITLQRKLQNDEAIAVAFEYTYNGQVYKVGELTEDYSSKGATDVVFLKMLRPKSIKNKDGTGAILPTWNLMMKNIYNLNVSQLSRDGFQLKVIYRDDRTGIDNPQLQDGDPPVRAQQLIKVIGLDRLNPYNDPQPDGNFDYVEGITINSATGLIIIPYLEPFNKPLRTLFSPPFETDPNQQAFLINKYLYDTLYHTTQAEAALVTTKNKFYISGTFKAGSGREIPISAFNITHGSVKVFSGGTPLREGTDFTVDYNFGKVTILNEGILSSGKDLDITYEQQDSFSFQTRSLLGTRLDYKLSDDVNIGGTFLYYNERPLITRNLIGNEPARNIQYGVDLNMKKNSRILTKMVDALPFLQTKEVSSVAINAEFAQLLPGTSNKIGGQGTSFVDDFENAATPYSLMSPQGWKLAATPTDPVYDRSNGAKNNLAAGDLRGKLSWFQIDNIFYINGTSSYAPPDIKLTNHYTRPVLPKEIFPAFDTYIGNFYQPILNLAYYPAERGPYNYNWKDIDPATGKFTKSINAPAANWAGITTAIRTNVDFDAANIEYLEFWMLNPFIPGANGVVDDGTTSATNNTTGGKLVFHIGNVSEDVGHDELQAFENGLPINGDISSGVYTNSAWGYVTNKQYINNAFDNSSGARANQDVGYDGLNSVKEADPSGKFSDFIKNVTPYQSAQDLLKDPSADDFQYYLGGDYDAQKAQILQRYKNYNGLENNSPVISGTQAFAASGTNIPDNEDLNADNNLNNEESYYTYNVNLKPGLAVGQKYIVDQITPVDAQDNNVTWYLFRIPIRDFDGQVGNINGFKTIKFIRMILTGFKQPVVLRMANFRTVGQRWRQYAGNLQESALGQVIEPDLDNFTVSTVNIEENSQADGVKPGYVEPLARDKDVTSVVQRRLNEQSGQLCVTALPDGDARAMYKNVSMDFFNYGRIKMFMSAHGPVVKDNQVKGFLRIGTDFDQNYYEIEIPLKITPPGTRIADEVWPEQNQIDLALDKLYSLKIQRDREGASLSVPYPLGAAKSADDGKHSIRIMGRPDLSQVKMLMIGVRNPKSSDGRDFDVCIWADELRLTDFDQTAGWAANVVMSAKLADLGTVSGSYRHIGFGYGDVQSKISARARSNTNQFDISMNLNLEKLLPRNTGLKIPMFFSYESIIIDPKYDPANPDLRIGAALQSFTNDTDRSNYLKLIQDRSYRRSLNFTNVRKTKVSKDAKSHIYDIENFAFTYSFTEANQTNFNLLENTRKNVKGAVAWQFNNKFEGFSPFKSVKLVSSKQFQLIKDFNFNPMPSSISVRGELERSFSKIAYRNSATSTTNSAPNYQKYFIFNRYYNFNWQLTKSLKVDYSSTVNAIIDEPDTDPGGGYSNALRRTISAQQYRDSVVRNLKSFGRIKYFEQNITATYALPFDKFPLLNWISSDYRYSVGYNWRAGPIQTDPKLQMGNVAQNSRTQGYTGKLDMLKLYNKIGFLKSINTPKPPPKPQPKNAAERAKQIKADTLPHPPELKLMKFIMRIVMSVRSVNWTYTISDGTILPGFTQSPRFFGLDQTWRAPGLGFVLGDQDPTIAHRSAQNGWITKNGNLTTAFSQNQTKDLSLTANLEPATDVKIQLTAKKTMNTSFQELFKYDTTANGFMDLSPSRSGSYRISFISVGTAFKNNGSLNSDVYEQFRKNLTILENRFKEHTGMPYQGQSQDVLIPAFIAAYSGRSAENVGLSPFPSIPLPNWRLDYNGLTKLEPFKDIFSSISIQHAYTSSYQVSSYTNSLQYNNSNGFDISQLSINNSVENYNSNRTLFASVSDTTSGKLIPLYVINTVLISETFAPLIGITLKTKNKLSITFNYKTKRDISLNVANAQINEVNGKEWSFELGYTKNNLRLPFKDQGRTITLKNDVTFRLTMGVVNNQTIQRTLDQGSSVTNGNINFQLRPNVSYVANKKLTVQIYVERTVNEPLVSNSFLRTTTKGGVKIIFNLAP